MGRLNTTCVWTVVGMFSSFVAAGIGLLFAAMFEPETLVPIAAIGIWWMMMTALWRARQRHTHLRREVLLIAACFTLGMAGTLVMIMRSLVSGDLSSPFTA